MTAAPLIVAGSWEDRLRQAKRLVDNHDDKAGPALRAIIDRLNRLPPAQLAAGSNHLYLVRYAAAITLEEHHLRNAELALATEVRREVLSWGEGFNEEDQPEHERLLVMLALQGRYEEALTYARGLVEQGADASENLTPIALMAIRCGDAQPVKAILTEIERDVNRERNPEESKKKRANLAICRVQLCLLRRQWEEASAWFEHACALNAAEHDDVVILYQAMVCGGEAERSLPLIERDTKHPMRATFWRGLALRALGKGDASRATWSNALGVDLRKFASNSGIFEWILCHYYLGEPAALGYALSLQIVKADPDATWFAHCIAGLGAALRGEVAGARVQMNVAQEKARVDLYSMYWGDNIRFHFDNLLTPEQMTPLLHYFQPQRPTLETTKDESATRHPG